MRLGRVRRVAGRAVSGVEVYMGRRGFEATVVVRGVRFDVDAPWAQAGLVSVLVGRCDRFVSLHLLTGPREWLAWGRERFDLPHQLAPGGAFGLGPLALVVWGYAG